MVDKADFSRRRSRALEYITPAKMAELERRASEYGLTVGELMENAGKGVADFVVSRYDPSRVCVVCGSGNNGGDGSVAARYLSLVCDTTVLLLTDPARIRTPEARKNWERLRETSAKRLVVDDTEKLKRSSDPIEKSDVIVVAILGTGMQGGVVREPLATAIDLINASRAAKVAVDLPSGLDASTGVVGRPTVRADVTLALHLPKVGLRERREFTGEIVVLPIGIRGKGE